MFPADRTDIFKKNNVERYIYKLDKEFFNGRYGILYSSCFAEIIAYYTLTSKTSNIEDECQPDIFNNALIENNHSTCNWSKIIKLRKCTEKIRFQKVKRILQYHFPNKHRFPEKYAHRLPYVFYPLRGESKDNLSDTVVIKVVKQNKIKFETFGDTVGENFASFNKRSLIK